MRLIDVDKLETHEQLKPLGNGNYEYVEVVYKDDIDDAPTIELERKKGKWIKEYWNGEHTRKCSECNITQTVTTYRGKVNFNYCPYCGADMRGEQ